MQQHLQESNYPLSSQYDQIQPQLHQPQQFVHGGNHFIPSNAVPVPSYYTVYPSQPPHQSMIDQPYPVYFVSGRQPQAYSLPLHQPSYNELPQTPPSSQPQTPPSYNLPRNIPSSKPEMVSGLYRTAATAAPQSGQIPSSQAQLFGYAPMPHPSSVNNSNYGYEFADPNHAQMYYTPLPPQLAAQYQNLKPSPAMAAKDAETAHHGSR